MRDYQSWQDQYHCNGSFVYPDTGALQGESSSVGAAGNADTSEAMSFGAAVELAVAMPLSWLPLTVTIQEKQRSR